MKRLALVLAAAAAIFATVPASAQDGMMHRERGMHRGEMHQGVMHRDSMNRMMRHRMHRERRMMRHRRHMMR